MSVFGPRENSTGTLPEKLDAYFQSKIKIQKHVGMCLSVFFLSSYRGDFPKLDSNLKTMMKSYDEFKSYPLDRKIDNLNSTYNKIEKLESIGYKNLEKNDPLILEKIYSRLKIYNVGIVLFYYESYDSNLKVLKFCKNDNECCMFFLHTVNKSSNIDEIYFLIPKYKIINLLMIVNKINRPYRFIHNCGKSLFKSELLYDNPNCRKCFLSILEFQGMYLGMCEHGPQYKISCGHGFCYQCYCTYNSSCPQCNYVLTPTEVTTISTMVYNQSGICFRCKNENYFSGLIPNCCIDCYYQNAINGTI